MARQIRVEPRASGRRARGLLPRGVPSGALLVLLCVGCTPPLSRPLPVSDPSPDTASPDTGTPDTASPDTDPPDSGPEGPCPRHMAEVQGQFCMDRYEATLEELQAGVWSAASPYLTVEGRTVRAAVAPGQVPQGYVSGDEAASACAAAGKRLCTSAEWLAACRGPEEQTYPYGDTWQAGACNDDYAGGHPVVDYFGTADGVWDSAHMNDPGINQQPGTVASGGAYAGCESAWGVFDLHGNLHEWVDDPEGTFRGGFYADAAINGAGCGYVTTAHSTGYHDYSTGFRCCVDPVGGER